MNLVSRIIPGALNNVNKDAIDWSYQGLIAYGCQSTVVILDPQSFRVKRRKQKKKLSFSNLFLTDCSMYGETLRIDCQSKTNFNEQERKNDEFSLGQMVTGTFLS